MSNVSRVALGFTVFFRDFCVVLIPFCDRCSTQPTRKYLLKLTGECERYLYRKSKIGSEVKTAESPNALPVECQYRSRDSEITLTQESGKQRLLPYQQLPGRREITCPQRIEIDTTCNRLTLRIPAIPIRRTAPTVIQTRTLMS